MPKVNVPSKNYKQYTEVSYSGRKLLERYPLTEKGTWQIFGEDSNCDLGGPHYEPPLGVLQGYLGDVIEYAVELPRFWQWGGGGRIEKIEIFDVTTEINSRKAELRVRKTALEKELAEVNNELGRI